MKAFHPWRLSPGGMFAMCRASSQAMPTPEVLDIVVLVTLQLRTLPSLYVFLVLGPFSKDRHVGIRPVALHVYNDGLLSQFWQDRSNLVKLVTFLRSANRRERAVIGGNLECRRLVVFGPNLWELWCPQYLMTPPRRPRKGYPVWRIFYRSFFCSLSRANPGQYDSCADAAPISRTRLLR